MPRGPRWPMGRAPTPWPARRGALGRPVRRQGVMATEPRIPVSERLKTPVFGLVRVLTWRKGGCGPSGDGAQVRDAAAAGAERLDHDGVELGAGAVAQLL